jgi:hypothetical protein
LQHTKTCITCVIRAEGYGLPVYNKAEYVSNAAESSNLNLQLLNLLLARGRNVRERRAVWPPVALCSVLCSSAPPLNHIQTRGAEGPPALDLFNANANLSAGEPRIGRLRDVEWSL